MQRTWAYTTPSRFPSGADPRAAALSARRAPRLQLSEKRVEFLVRFEDLGGPLLGRLHRLHPLGRGKLLDRHTSSGTHLGGSRIGGHVVDNDRTRRQG